MCCSKVLFLTPHEIPHGFQAFSFFSVYFSSIIVIILQQCMLLSLSDLQIFCQGLISLQPCSIAEFIIKHTCVLAHTIDFNGSVSAILLFLALLELFLIKKTSCFSVDLFIYFADSHYLFVFFEDHVRNRASGNLYLIPPKQLSKIIFQRKPWKSCIDCRIEYISTQRDVPNKIFISFSFWVLLAFFFWQGVSGVSFIVVFLMQWSFHFTQ